MCCVDLDKRDDSIRKVQRERQFAFTRDVDQVHVHSPETVVIRDGDRSVFVEKVGSMTTVVWNPWSTLTPGFADLPEDAWRHFVCVETVNSADDRLTLAPGASHGMALTIRCEETR